MKPTSIINFTSIRSGCYNCGLFDLCQPNLKKAENISDDKFIKHNHKFDRGKHIFRVNDEFKTVYAICTGSIKTYTSLDNGKEQVTGFHLPGELLGLESISTGYHTESAIALESCTLCQIPFNRLEDLSHNRPALQHALLNAMSEEILYDHRQLTLVSRVPAEPRLASFLLSISENFKRRGLSSSDFYLSMTRSDIANLLGLAVETISRLFSQFQDKGLLAAERKHIVLLNIKGLENLAKQLKPTGNIIHEKAS